MVRAQLIVTPSRTRPTARRVFSGVRKLSVPSWSSTPQRPQLLKVLKYSRTASPVGMPCCIVPPRRWYRYRPPLYGASPGTSRGIGLYMMQEIVAAHDGELRVTSHVGSGTTFTITLPLVCGVPIVAK